VVIKICPFPARPQTGLWAIFRGAQTAISKPFNFSTLRDKLMSFLAKYFNFRSFTVYREKLIHVLSKSKNNF
jgi:hypothetical protein